MLILLGAGCSYPRFQYSFEQERLSDLTWSQLPEPPATHVLIGTAKADEKGSLFDNCERLIERAVLTIADEARFLGGDTVGKQVWFPNDDPSYDTPRCKKRWGFFFTLPLPLIFTPWFMSATVEAPVFKKKAN